MSAVPIETLELVPPLDEWMSEQPDEGVDIVAELVDQPPIEVPGIEELVPQPPIERMRWRITSERGAVWAMRKLQAAIDDRTTHVATAKAEQDRIKSWLAAVTGPLEGSIDHFSFLLDEFHRGIVDRDLELVDAPPTLAGPVSDAAWGKVKHKTLTVPNGKVEARRAGGKFDVVDEDAALECLREHAPHLIKWTPAVTSTSISEGGAEWNDELDCYEFPIRCEKVDMLQIATERYPDARVDYEETAADGAAGPATVWVPIPGIRLDGAGVVKFTPKPA